MGDDQPQCDACATAKPDADVQPFIEMGDGVQLCVDCRIHALERIMNGTL